MNPKKTPFMVLSKDEGADNNNDREYDSDEKKGLDVKDKRL